MTQITHSLTSRVLKTDITDWRQFQFIQQDEFKEIPKSARDKLKASILANEFTQPFYVWEEPGTGVIFCLDGKHRTMILEELAQEGHVIPDRLPATFIDCLDKFEAAKLVLVYSSMYAKVTQQGLFDFIQMYDFDFNELKATIDIPEFDTMEFEGMFRDHSDDKAIIARSLQERFIVPPFSIFDSRQGYWQERKKLWHTLGFNSQETRDEVELIAKSGQSPAIYELRNKMRDSLGRDPDWDEIIAQAKVKGLHIYEGASIFDPVLTEICYRWFCPDNGQILDPFAGGSVRGIVAGILGYNYSGIDLREDQVKANIAQWKAVRPESAPAVYYLKGDSNQLLSNFDPEYSADFVFSCPPYHDLEQYSDDPADLSNMDYPEFLNTYQSIIFKACDKLKENRFACFVVGDIRDKQGIYRNFVSDTIAAFQDAGLHLYNEIILINVAGSLPIRIGRQFEGYRKVGKMHQNVLVFFKGDPKTIKTEFTPITIGDLGNFQN